MGSADLWRRGGGPSGLDQLSRALSERLRLSRLSEADLLELLSVVKPCAGHTIVGALAILVSPLIHLAPALACSICKSLDYPAGTTGTYAREPVQNGVMGTRPRTTLASPSCLRQLVCGIGALIETCLR